MTNDWTPFFHALFWFATKVAGLYLAVHALVFAPPVLFAASGFWGWIVGVALVLGLPVLGAYVLLGTDVVHALATEGRRSDERRRSRA